MPAKMMRMGIFLLGALTLGLLGCGKGREQTAVDLEEARLLIASAKKAGADIQATVLIDNAESYLSQAEQAFRNGKYGTAKVAAIEAGESARAAYLVAKKKTAAAKAPKRVKRPIITRKES